MTGDSRVTAAAEFLAGARKRKGSELPHSVLVREAAELRRQLGQVLDVIAGRSRQAPVLSESWSAVLGQALADAMTYRDPSGACPDCDAHPAGLCEDHADDLDKTDAYLALAAELGIEVDR